MSSPIAIIIQELEGTPTSVRQILQTLHYKSSTLDSLPKSELKHLISRTSNLAQSHQPYNKWCGINIIKVLCENFAILAQEGNGFMGILLKTLEASSSSTDVSIIKSTIECLDSLCDRIRGKPTLTREVLTPRLPQIFALYMDKLNLYPQMLIKSLTHFMINHPTTFRPYGNKLHAKLLDLLTSPDYVSFTPRLKKHVCQAIATLPIIEKNDPELFWQNKLNQIISETADVLSVFKEFLDFSDSSEIVGSLNQLTSQKEFEPLFPPLEIDISKPETISHLVTRVEVLLNLVVAFVTSETKFSVHVPLGKIIVLFGTIFAINLRSTSFKGDIRDEGARNVISSVIDINQRHALTVLPEISQVYPGPIVMHLGNILSFLEAIIPFKKFIITEEIINNERLYVEVIKCVTALLKTVASYDDSAQFVRFVEAALALVAPREKAETTAPAAQASKGRKQKKNNQSAPLADLLSHAHLLHQTVPPTTVVAVREFINTVITRVELPSKQHYKVMRYIVLEAVNMSSSNEQGGISKPLRDLLINSVLYPSFENTSILPIVSSLLGDDPVLSVFKNPRFPPLPKLIKVVDEEEEEDEEMDDVEEEEVVIGIKRQAESLEQDTKRAKTEESTFVEPKVEPIVNQSKIFKPAENPTEVLQFPDLPSNENKIERAAEQVEEFKPVPVRQPVKPTPAPAPVEDEGDSDFEMPSIDIDESEDEK